MKRHAILAEMHKQIALAVHQSATPEGNGQSAAIAQGLQWRKLRNEALGPDAERDAYDGISLTAEELEKQQGTEAAVLYADVAYGRATPLTELHEDWLKEKSFVARSLSDHRLAVAELKAWLDAQRLPATLEAVTDRVASAYKSRQLVDGGMHWKTANKRISSLSSYWQWLTKQGHISSNPWRGKSLPKAQEARDDKERPFTDEEVQRLLSGKPDQTVSDMLWLSLLSGMRIDEIFQLRVRHCGDGVFKVAHGTKGKTAAAERVVPIHPQLLGIVKRLTVDRGPDAYFIAESSKGHGVVRSTAASKRFTTYRRALGIDERREGKRRSLVNFHSARRWFITKADQAGCARDDIERLVGHKAQGMSLGVYSAGMSLEQARKVVESVKLPNRVQSGLER